jgi:hypothetical protein
MRRNKIIVTAVFMLFFMGGHMTAKSQYYYRVGDTIRGRDTIYHYQWWSEDYLSDTSNHFYMSSIMWDTVVLPGGAPGYQQQGVTKGVLLRYCYTEQPLKIVGIATACYFGHSDWEFWIPQPLPDSMHVQAEFLEIYDADTGRDSFPRVAQLEYDYDQPPRYMQLDVRHIAGHNNYCCSTPNSQCEEIPEIREFYLDKPVTVRDSFYVGHTTNNNRHYGVCLEEMMDANYVYGDHIMSFFGRYVGWEPKNPMFRGPCADPSCPGSPLSLYKYRKFISTDMYTCDTVDPSWHWCVSNFFMLDFPIIEIDSSFYDGPPQYVCPAVDNLHIGNQEAGSVVLLWSSQPDQLRWEVSYGPQGTPPDSGTVQIASIPAIMISGLDSSTHYSAYIRAVCMHDSLVYSDWSEPLDICICDTGGTSAIETPLLEQLTYLMPNPATWQVQVLSSYGMTRVEAYNLQGKRMADVNVKGLGTILDVSDWPAGMYVVVIHTPAGNATKKLIVTR